MTNDPARVLHPSLRGLAAARRRRLRLVGLLLFLLAMGALLFVVVTALTSPSAGGLLLLGLVGLAMLPVVALLGGLLWYLDHRLARVLDAADRLLRDCAPQAMRLTPVERASSHGILVALRPAAVGSPLQDATHALIDPSLGWRATPTQAAEVQLYCRALSEGADLVALEADGLALVGQVVDRENYQRKKRRLRVAALLALLLVAVSAATAMMGSAG